MLPKSAVDSGPSASSVEDVVDDVGVLAQDAVRVALEVARPLEAVLRQLRASGTMLRILL